jgi:hypothetical protein
LVINEPSVARDTSMLELLEQLKCIVIRLLVVSRFGKVGKTFESGVEASCFPSNKNVIVVLIIGSHEISFFFTVS